MNEDEIEGRAVIERYLQGKLTPDEQAAFEEAYLSDPYLLKSIELAERLRQGLKDLDEAGEIERPSGSSWPGFLSSPLYAAAASVLMLVSLTLSVALYRENVSLQNTAGSLDAPQARLERLLTVRGSSVNEIAAPDEGELLILLVDAGFTDFESYRATVLRRGPASVETVWEAVELQPGYEESLAIAVPGSLLRPGDYEIVVEGELPVDAAFEIVDRLDMTIHVRDAP